MRIFSKTSQVLGAVVLGCVVISHLGVGAEMTWPPAKARLGLLKDGTSLIGKRVEDSAERNVGVIQDLLLNPTNGQVIATLVSMGRGGGSVIVPAECYFTVAKNRAVVRVDRKQVESAPGFPAGMSLAKLDIGRLNESFQHFELPAIPASALTTDRFCSALALIGTHLIGEQDEPLGRVMDFMVDLAVGELVYLVVEPGSGQDLYPVPSLLVRPEPAGQRLMIKSDKAQFLAGPHFPREFWTGMALPSMANAVGKHYGLALQAGSTPREKARSDQEINSAILSEIVRLFRGSQALNIAVQAADGRVTLSGAVRNEKQERQVLEAAEKVVGTSNVVNRLVVRGRR